MSYDSKIENNIAIITISARRLDAAIAPELKETVVKTLADGAEKVIVNLAQVAFMDSSGLGAIIGSFKLVGQNGEFILCNLQESVKEIFKLTHMDRVFDIHENLDDGYQRLCA